MRLIIIICLTISNSLISQNKIDTIEVSPNKLTQIIFPSAVKHREPGSNAFGVLKNQELDNKQIIRIQYDDDEAKDRTDISNLQVETVDGYIYDLPLINTRYPKKTSCIVYEKDAITNIKSLKSYGQNTDFKNDRNSSKGKKSFLHYSNKSLKTNSNPNSVSDSIHIDSIAKSVNIVKNMYSRFKTRAVSHNIKLALKAIFTERNELYFVFNIKNEGNQPYDITKWKFYRASDKHTIKLKTGESEGYSLSQELLFKTIRVYNLKTRIEPNSENDFTIVTSKFTIGKDKAIYLDIDELNGEQDIYLPIFYNKINNPLKFKNSKKQ